MMKKTLALILAMVMCFALLTACGDTAGKDLKTGLNKDVVDDDGQRYG